MYQSTYNPFPGRAVEPVVDSATPCLQLNDPSSPLQRGPLFRVNNLEPRRSTLIPNCICARKILGLFGLNPLLQQRDKLSRRLGCLVLLFASLLLLPPRHVIKDSQNRIHSRERLKELPRASLVNRVRFDQPLAALDEAEERGASARCVEVVGHPTLKVGDTAADKITH